MGGARSSLPCCPSNDTVPLCFPTSKIRDEGVGGKGVQGHGHWDLIPYLWKPEKPLTYLTLIFVPLSLAG